jgi:hypothetical protein
MTDGYESGYESEHEKTSHGKLKLQTWSLCATEGGDSDPNSDASDVENISGEDLSIEDYDSDEYSAVVSEVSQAQPRIASARDQVSKESTMGLTRQDVDLETRKEKKRRHPSLYESRLIRDRTTLVEKKFAAKQDAAATRSPLIKQELAIPAEAPVPDTVFKPGLWGLSLDDAVGLAGQDVDRMVFDIHGTSLPFSGRVPIVVARCMGKIMNSMDETVSCCLRVGSYPDDPEQFAQLKEAFHAPPTYGTEIDWTRYSAFDAAHVLFDYLKSLPPLIPSDLSCKLPSLDDYIQNEYIPSDLASLQIYATCMRRMPQNSRQLLLILIAFLASQVGFAERYYSNDRGGFFNEAATCCSTVLSHALEHRRATFTLLVVNAGYFMGLANRRPPTYAEWNDLIAARTRLVDSRGTIRQAQTEETMRDFRAQPEASSSPEPSQTDPSNERQEEPERINTHDHTHEQVEEIDHDDRGSTSDEPRHTPRSIVEDESDADQGLQGLSDNDVEAVPEEVLKPSEREWTRKLVECKGKGPPNKSKAPAVATEDDFDGDFHEVDTQNPQYTPPELALSAPEVEYLPQVQPELESEPLTMVDVPSHLEMVHLQYDDSISTKQDTTEEEVFIPLAPSPPLSPWEPPIAADSIQADWRQYLEGVSLPPSPRLDTRLLRVQPSRVNITSLDDSLVMQAAFEERLGQDRLALIQKERLSTPREADLEVHAGTEDSIARKRRHRRSNSSWISIPKQGRPRSAAGESVKSVGRKSTRKAEEELRRMAEKGHKKSNSTSSKPKGFRETLHDMFH